MEALLKNKNITFDETGIADIKAGKIDPRVIAAMTKLSEDHKITVTCMCSDHSRATAGGSVSNHSLGRGLDIGTIDGEIVRPNSAAARELASELSQLPEEYRPNEIGSPFAISGPGYFTDAAHQDHIHFGFKQEISKDWRPPADVAAGGLRGAPAAVAAAVPGAPARGRPPLPGAPVAAAAAAAPAAPKPGDSGQFLAAQADAAGAKKGGSGAFMAVQPVGPASALARPRGGPGRGRRRRRGGAGVGEQHPRCGGLEDRGDPARREGGGHQHRRQGRRVPQGGGRAARQPVVRELRDVGAGPERPQDGGRRLGRGADVGPQRRGGQERPPDRQRRGGPPRRHRHL